MGFGKLTLVCGDPHQLTPSLSLSVSLGQSWGRALFGVQILSRGFPDGSVVKNLPANAVDAGYSGLIPGSGRSPGGENGNPLQYSCQENLMDRGAWWAMVHGVTKSWTQLK